MNKAQTKSSRVAAVRALQGVLDHGRSFNDAALDEPLAKMMTYGALRWLPVLRELLAAYLKKPLRQRDRPIEYLLLVGLYQLGWLDKPAHAIINETVGATSQLGRPWARGLVNGVLRQYQRDGCPRQVPSAATMTAHPDWLIKRIESAWPQQAASIFSANNQQAPMWLRVNRQRLKRRDYVAQLASLGINASTSSESASAVCLERPHNVAELPGFEDGVVSVQDLAAQLAAPLLQCEAGDRVLDACAAPGGKTAHLLELASIKLHAIDNEPQRAKRIDDNLRRLSLSAQVEVRDARELAAQRYDRILLDVPCSATGVIRRHPDIKWLRRADDIAQSVVTQREMLQAAWQALRPTGRLLYTTCSILPDENSEQIDWFLRHESSARLNSIVLGQGIDTGRGWQRLPADGGGDGFFYASLSKAER